MEAHAGTIRIGTGITTRPRLRSLQLLLARARARRRARAIRTHDARLRSIPGSEHAHLILPPKAI
jgi:hypothetical protein